MKLNDILSENSHFDTFEQIVEFMGRATTNHFMPADHNGHIMTGQTVGNVLSSTNIEKILHQYPMLEYNGPMVRFVYVPGNVEHITPNEIINHTEGRSGLQSWARTEAGLDFFLEQAGDELEFSGTEVFLKQNGRGLSIEHIITEAQRRDPTLGHRAKQLLSMGAKAQEILAPYYSPSVYHTQYHNIDDEW